MAQFSSQFEAVVIESALARTFNGNCGRVSHGSALPYRHSSPLTISPVTTHAQGPQEQAKKKM